MPRSILGNPWHLFRYPYTQPGVMSWAARPPFLPQRHAAGQCGPVGVRKEMHCGVASRWRRRRPWLDPAAAAAAAAAGEQQTPEPEPGEAGRDGMGDSGRGECPSGRAGELVTALSAPLPHILPGRSFSGAPAPLFVNTRPLPPEGLSAPPLHPGAGEFPPS